MARNVIANTAKQIVNKTGNKKRLDIAVNAYKTDRKKRNQIAVKNSAMTKKLTLDEKKYN
jgi:hypothetical protein